MQLLGKATGQGEGTEFGDIPRSHSLVTGAPQTQWGVIL